MCVRLGQGWRICTKNRRVPNLFSSSDIPKRSLSKWSTLRLWTSSQSPHIELQPKHGGSVVVQVAVALGFVLSCSLVLNQSFDSWNEARRTSGPQRVIPIETTTRHAGPANMVHATLPGRPGNLTAEQESRLHEMWLATLKVFAVTSSDGKEMTKPEDGLGMVDGHSTPSANSVQRQRADTVDSNKKHKKRISLFGRRQRADTHDQEDASLDGGDVVHRDDRPSTSDGDDKYGQSKGFAEAIATQSPEHLREAFWAMVKHDHPDGLLLRFLRARKWDVQKALVMLISTMHWRMQEMHVDDDIMKHGEAGALEDVNSADAGVKKEANDFLAQLRMGKSFLHGTDKEDRPMCFVRVRLHKQGEQSEASLERYTVFVIETARMLLASPVETAVGFCSESSSLGPLTGPRL